MDGVSFNDDLGAAYVVEKVLEKAIFGEILLVKHKRSERRIAIKAIVKSLAAERICVKGTPVFESFGTEFEVLKKVRECPHPNLIPLGPDEDQHETHHMKYVAMPWLSGGELFAKVKESGSLGEDEVRPLCRRIAEGLRHLHTKIGFCHNDISLENVLLTGDGAPVICDYGLAQRINSRWETARHISGKLPYQAPEIYHGTATVASPQADVFALGVAMFVLLTGIPPFELPDTLHDKRYAYIQCGRLDELLQLWGLSISSGVVSLLSDMLAHDPMERCTIRDVLEHPWVAGDEEEEEEEDVAGGMAIRSNRGSQQQKRASLGPSSPNSVFSFEEMYTNHVSSSSY